MAYQPTTLGFLIHDVWAGREPSIFEVWAAPGAPKTIQKDWICLNGFPGPRGRPDPENCFLFGRPKNHVLKTHPYNESARLGDGRAQSEAVGLSAAQL